MSDIKLVELQSLTAWLRRASGVTDVVPEMSPEAAAALKAGYSLPQHLGLELSFDHTIAPSLTLCDDFESVQFVDCVGVDMLPSKGDVSLDKVSLGPGRLLQFSVAGVVVVTDVGVGGGRGCGRTRGYLAHA